MNDFEVAITIKEIEAGITKKRMQEILDNLNISNKFNEHENSKRIAYLKFIEAGIIAGKCTHANQIVADGIANSLIIKKIKLPKNFKSTPILTAYRQAQLLKNYKIPFQLKQYLYED